jgi:transposase
VVTDDLWAAIRPLLPPEPPRTRGAARVCRIARRWWGTCMCRGLGRHHWVVERTLARLACYRRLAIRYERRADIHQALLDRACAHICLNFLRRPDRFC